MNLSTLNPNELVGPSGRNVQSAYFDGVSDSLTVPYTPASFDWWTSDFTIEAWVYATSWSTWSGIHNGNNRPSLVGNMATLSTTNYWSFGPTTTGNLAWYYFNGSELLLSSSATIRTSQWNHIAATKTSSGITFFINGVAETPIAISGTPLSSNTQPLTIGSHRNISISGYVSNLRIIKGTALYTGNFTPPTAPLTPIANTSFLLGFSPYQFIDQSPNNFTITRNGDTTQSTFGPYGNNWSNYFDGTGDYLSMPSNAAFAYGTGEFTVECWVYKLTSATMAVLDSNTGSPGTFGFAILSTQISAYQTWGTAFTFTHTLALNSWQHIAFVRTSGTLYLYVNGTQIGSTAASQNFVSTQPLIVGRNAGSGSDQYNGYISNLRIVKGAAVYTANFTPPTAPLSSIPNTSLLTCQSNRFLDASPNNFAITRNGDVSVQPYVPFPANWSNFFDGNGDSLRFNSSGSAVNFTGAYTIECFFYLSSNLTYSGSFGAYAGWLWSAGSTGSNGGIQLSVKSSGTGTSVPSVLALGTYGTATPPLISATGLTIEIGRWHHLAASRDSSNNTAIFLNGNRVVNGVVSGSYLSRDLEIGGDADSPDYLGWFPGYISNLRVIKDAVIYDPTKTTLTVPTTPLTAIPNTSLLTCQSSSFTDFSSNNFAVTVTGDVSARFYGPFSGPVPEPVVDVYTTTGVANTWIKRPGAKAVQMIAIGAGGGGGGGMGSASGVQRNGGAGGGGGANGQIVYTADQLPSTLYIRVGASGTGGASNTSGGAGGNSTIAAADPITTSTSVYCMGGGGGGGEAGAASSSSVGGGGGGTAGAGTTGTGENAVSGGLPALGAGFWTGGGGAGGGNGAAGTTSYAAEWGGGGGGGVRNDGANRQPGGGSMYGGGGGGVGGFLNSGGGGTDGICGGASGRYTFGTDQASFGGGAAGVASAGGAGANASTVYAAGSGGGGGGTSGFAGGAGGFPGGGGGGGGASATTGGTGGVGGAGRVVLVTFF